MRKPDSTVARRAFGLRKEERKNAQQNDTPFRASALFPRPAPLFCILFSGKAEKSMPPEAQLQCRCKKQHFRCIRKGVPRLRRGRADRGVRPYSAHTEVRQRLCVLRAQKRCHPLRGDKRSKPCGLLLFCFDSQRSASSPFSTSTVMVAPGRMLPSTIFFASSVSTVCCT